jgi:hypothetical protein
MAKEVKVISGYYSLPCATVINSPQSYTVYTVPAGRVAKIKVQRIVNSLAWVSGGYNNIGDYRNQKSAVTIGSSDLTLTNNATPNSNNALSMYDGPNYPNSSLIAGFWHSHMDSGFVYWNIYGNTPSLDHSSPVIPHYTAGAEFAYSNPSLNLTMLSSSEDYLIRGDNVSPVTTTVVKSTYYANAGDQIKLWTCEHVSFLTNANKASRFAYRFLIVEEY